MIEVKNLTKTYKVNGQYIKAVDGVSFDCKKGEYISVVGHSGSGKSTLLSLIGGLTNPDSGDIIIGGTSLLSLNDTALSEFRNRKLNFIFQFASLIPTLTAIENIMLPSAFSLSHDRTKQEIKKEAAGLLEIVGLADKVNVYQAQLSGGQQRRVAIVRSFINNPDIILADEPTGDLDEETEAGMMKIFKKINQEKGTTFIVVTHSSTIANEANRVFRMHNGRLKEVKT